MLGVKSSFQQAVWGSSTPSGYDSYGGHQSPASPGYGRGVTLSGQGEDTVHTNKVRKSAINLRVKATTTFLTLCVREVDAWPVVDVSNFSCCDVRF